MNPESKPEPLHITRKLSVEYRKYQFVGEDAQDQIVIATLRDRPDVQALLIQADAALSGVFRIYLDGVREARIARGYTPPPPLLHFD